MAITVDLHNPHFVIKCDGLFKASEISKLIKDAGILTETELAYAFTCCGHYIKIGMSDNTSKMTGERVYRQASNIAGWDTIPRGSSGKDILPSLVEFENEYGFGVHINDVEIHIWDVTNITNENRDQSNAKVAEDRLLTQYEMMHGKLPVGNPKDTRYRGSFVSNTIFLNLFDEDEDE